MRIRGWWGGRTRFERRGKSRSEYGKGLVGISKRFGRWV